MPSRFELLKELAELFAILGILSLFFLHPAIRRFPAAGGRRIVFLTVAAFFAAAGMAQLTTRNQYVYPQRREPFPFTRWAMFSGMTDRIETALIYEFRGVRNDGSSTYLNPARLFVTPNVTVHFTKTQSLASAILSDKPVESQSAMTAANAYARGLLNRHNACHPDSPISKVELWERRILMQLGTRVPDPFMGPECRIVQTFNGD